MATLIHKETEIHYQVDGELLERLRRKAGYETQQELADVCTQVAGRAAPYTQQFIQKLERPGLNNISPEFASVLEQIFH